MHAAIAVQCIYTHTHACFAAFARACHANNNNDISINSRFSGKTELNCQLLRGGFAPIMCSLPGGPACADVCWIAWRGACNFGLLTQS